ncbi:restriction endonuclease subunit S [Amaricoccus sp.]|uniref:restriction endonuclease subunit S n=1 Tax=Amaricoccus sp. TaxID=1872485 RepID=UPI001B62604C|nr:restriction endonuclease subunit S [Amaricoccus sp.]MBP7003646.1 restriction endonuclease subunit S [Amaricoccus sp.]
MAGDGRRTTLGEAAELLTGFPFKSAAFSDDPSNIRLLRGDNIVQGRTRWDGAKRWPSDAVSEYRDYQLRSGDVVLAMDRPWIEAGLKHATLTEADCPSLLVQRVARLRARPGVDQRFLGYVIRSTDFTNYVLAAQTGTAVPHISGGQIKAYEFTLPSTKQQMAAAELLGSLDDKIELNRRMAETLEAMARALFRSWFVDFDPVRAKAEGWPTHLPDDVAALFPDRLGGNGLPDEWANNADAIAELSRSIVSPKEVDPATPYIGLDHLPRRSLIVAQRGKAEEVDSAKTAFASGDLLFGKLRPYFHKVSIAPFDGICSSDIFVFKPRAGVPASFLYFSFSQDRFVRSASNASSGTRMPRADWNYMRQQPQELPPTDLLNKFDKLASPLIAKMLASTQ